VSSSPFGRILLVLIVPLLALAACSDDDSPAAPEKDPVCSITPDTLDFGTIAVGDVRDLTFTVKNTGGGTLSGDISETCTHFSILAGGGAFSLDGGESVVVTVRFEPIDEGPHTCAVQTGLPSCGAVACLGEAQYAWEVVYSNAYQGWFDIWGTSASDIWAVGYDIIHYDGSSWTITTNPSDKTLYAVWGAGPDDIYAVGMDYFSHDGVIIHYNGTSWGVVLDDVGAVGFLGVWGSAWNDVYAVGMGGSAYYYDGMSWSPFFIGGVISYAVWGTASDDVYIIGDTGRIQHNNGSMWEGMASGISSALLGIWGNGIGDVFITSNSPVILEYHGSTWETMQNDGSGSGMEDIWGTSSTDLYCVGPAGRIMRYRGTNWSDMISPTTQKLMGIWGTSPTNIYAVGEDGVIVRYTGD
jgi:hypothetical protein